MIVFPNAKINLGLYILEKREDGYHNIESVLYPVPWLDVLEIIPGSETDITFSGIPIQGDPQHNLCYKVFNLLQGQFNLPPVKIHLHKNIPVGAGLGGGSSDAAFTVKLLNEMFRLHLSEEQMEEIVKPFGSDCAFFVKNKPAFAEAKGDKLSPISPILKGKYIVLIFPDLSISTKEAYEGVVAGQKRGAESLKKILSAPDNEWKQRLENNFENSLFINYPVLANIKTALYNMGAIYASMSGSGSTVYGLFDKEVIVSENFPAIYETRQGWL